MKKIKILDRIKAFFSGNTERVKIPLYGSWQHFENSEEFNNSEVLNYKVIDKEGFDLFEIPLEHAVAIYYDNDSMLPSIKSGWVALIDRRKIEFINNELYAVILNNKIEFRILENSTSSTNIKLIPQNNNFETVESTREDLNVLGKIEYILGRANITNKGKD
ncbi:MAG: S24 family peptidase [Neisseriales bacterium]|nr:MAG: S24 family peptidase [Neisseriales bacterium]